MSEERIRAFIDRSPNAARPFYEMMFSLREAPHYTLRFAPSSFSIYLEAGDKNLRLIEIEDWNHKDKGVVYFYSSAFDELENEIISPRDFAARLDRIPGIVPTPGKYPDHRKVLPNSTPTGEAIDTLKGILLEPIDIERTEPIAPVDIQVESPDHNVALELLLSKKQVILFGPPGTGKTYSTRSLAVNACRR